MYSSEATAKTSWVLAPICQIYATGPDAQPICKRAGLAYEHKLEMVLPSEKMHWGRRALCGGMDWSNFSFYIDGVAYSNGSALRTSQLNDGNWHEYVFNGLNITSNFHLLRLLGFYLTTNQGVGTGTLVKFIACYNRALTSAEITSALSLESLF